MLNSISIRNYALIDALEIDFGSGFTVITGETGAGKSILLGALSLLLGKRADSAVIGDVSRKCVVEGVFDISALDLAERFKKHDLDYEDETLIRREILPGGRSRAFINDTPVALSVLKQFGSVLVDIHSQHETLLLGDSNFQMDVLDIYAGLENRLAAYSAKYDDYRQTSRKLKALTETLDQAKRDQDYYQYLFDELEALNLDPDAFNVLKEREAYLAHAEEVRQALAKSDQIINEKELSLNNQITEIVKSLAAIRDYLPAARELYDRFESLKIELDDLALEIARLNQSAEYDPAELDQVNQQLDQIYAMQQKHHVQTVEALLELKDDFQNKLTVIDSGDEEVAALKDKKHQLSEELKTLADALHEKRTEYSRQFAKDLILLLGDLGMQQARFEVDVIKQEAFSNKGRDSIEFNFNANRGSRLQSLDKVASGGELSRLMLAIKSLVTRERLLPTVIFDEIDAGVSGDIAAKVGNILKRMSGTHQVIAISHLPQIAAKADHHFRVFKQQQEEATFTMISKLDDNGRVDEIAKLLSDEKVSDAAVSTARELLNY